jgi:hypothetical protein
MLRFYEGPQQKMNGGVIVQNITGREKSGCLGKGVHRKMGGTATNSLMASGYSVSISSGQLRDNDMALLGWDLMGQ